MTRSERTAALSLRIATALTSVVLVFALLELALRGFTEPPPRVLIEGRADGDTEGPLPRELDQSPDFRKLYIQTPAGLRLRPDTRAVLRNERLSGRDIEIRTNSLGYRGPEVDAGEGTRILFLGDSITLANYLPEAETFVAQVGAIGSTRGHRWNVINAGVGTISLANELAILEETGLSTDPDVVVLAFYLNDFLESPGVFVADPPRWLAWSRLARFLATALPHQAPPVEPEDSRLVARIGADLETRLNPGPGSWQRFPQAFDQLILGYQRDWGGAWSQVAWDAMQPIFEELLRLSDRYGFRLAFIAFPVRFQTETDFVEDWPQRRLAAVAESLGVPFLDLLPVHRGAEGELFYDHCHHTPQGARIVGEAIAEFLEARVLGNDATRAAAGATASLAQRLPSSSISTGSRRSTIPR